MRVPFLVGAVLVFASFVSAADAKPSRTCGPEEWVQVRSHPAMWGQHVAIVADVDGDGVDEIVCRGPDTRLVKRLRLYASSTFRVYSGGSGDVLGELRDLPFVSGTERFPTTIRDDPERPLLVAVGIAPTEPPRLRIALIDVVTMSMHSVVTASAPLETSLAALRRHAFGCAEAYGHDAAASLLLSYEAADGRLRRTMVSVTSGGISIDAEIESNIGPHRGLVALRRMWDVDGDGIDDHAMAWAPAEDSVSDTPGAQGGAVTAGRVDILSGKTGQIVRTIRAPTGAGAFGGALFCARGANGVGGRLYIGAPGWKGTLDGSEILRPGAVYVAEGPDLDVRRLVGVEELADPDASPVTDGNGRIVADRFGERLAGLVHDGETFLAIGSPGDSLFGSVYCVDASGRLRWTARGGPDGRLDMMSDYRFGERIIAPHGGRAPFFLVNARWPSSEGGRIVLFDARNGELVRTLAP